MEVVFAKNYGFCMGVNRAVKLMEQLILENPDRKIVTIGPLIHNPSFLQELEQRGVVAVDEDAKLEARDLAVIRTHGLSPVAYEKFSSQGVTLIDATCPKVKRSQRIISDYTANSKGEGWVLIAGDRNHGEVSALCGFATNAVVLQNKAEALALLEEKKITHALLLAQTTFSPAEYDEIVLVLKEKIPHLTVEDTICKATKMRQDALRELLPQVDAVFVVGGRTSANTTRLVKIAEQGGKPCWHIETAQEIPPSFFEEAEVKNWQKIGVTAGASTPQGLIDSVISVLKR